ncbi:MAG: hypothetical protein HY521_04340 [Proteobacteria bacterium]|nr:hypothetical protein [Pseudomonadota bacterium]
MTDETSAEAVVRAAFAKAAPAGLGGDAALRAAWQAAEARALALVKERERAAYERVAKLLDEEALKRGGRMSARGLILQHLREAVRRMADETASPSAPAGR